MGLKPTRFVNSTERFGIIQTDYRQTIAIDCASWPNSTLRLSKRY